MLVVLLASLARAQSTLRDGHWHKQQQAFEASLEAEDQQDKLATLLDDLRYQASRASDVDRRVALTTLLNAAAQRSKKPRIVFYCPAPRAIKGDGEGTWGPSTKESTGLGGSESAVVAMRYAPARQTCGRTQHAAHIPRCVDGAGDAARRTRLRMT
jgi:hypothetical protein